MIKRLFIIFLICFYHNGNAAFFGASSYEECMNDGKVGRTTAELRMLINKCQKQFPTLKKLYEMKDSNVSCVSSDGSDVDNFKISKNIITTASGNSYGISFRSADTIIVKSNWYEDRVTKKRLPTIYRLTTTNGSATLTLETSDVGLFPPTTYYNCVEK